MHFACEGGDHGLLLIYRLQKSSTQEKVNIRFRKFLRYCIMDKGFQNMGFAASYRPNAFEILGSSMQVTVPAAEYNADTDLRLTSMSKGIKRKWSSVDATTDLQAGFSLALGLGSSSSSDSKGSSATACTTMSSAREIDEESSMDLELDFSLHLGNEKMSSLKKSVCPNVNGPGLLPKVDLELSLSTGTSESDITGIHPIATSDFGLEMPLAVDGAYDVDERSTSVCWQPNLALPPVQDMYSNDGSLLNQNPIPIEPSSIIPDLSCSVLTGTKSSVTCTSGITQRQPHQRSSSSKTCLVEGCGKGARGASGCCIAHGGGRRCQKPGCHKGAEGRTVYCKAHGGGRRCEFLGCTKSAEGRTDFCIAHGGGRRCSHEGCTRAARGKSGLCIRHGGGKRCQMENCTKSAEGLSGLCISHGGGRRCQAPGCTKGAQGSTMYCKAHGGGKRCTFPGCTKGAEGSTPFCKGHGGGKRCAFQGGGICTKSVHGGTNFCVAHGGGKRCSVPKCTKSARGRTDFCVRHGGGKRCKFEGCSKSAQGSTDFCKAHGGGKRCSWGHPGSEYGAVPTRPCNSFARGKTGLCALHSSLVQDKRVHGGVTLGPMVHNSKLKMKEVFTVENMNIDSTNSGADPGALVSRATDFRPSGFANAPFPVGEAAAPSMPFSVPEGRVHGGSLLAVLAAGSGVGTSSNKAAGTSSEPINSYEMPRRWV